MRQHVARIRKLVRRLVDRAALCLPQYTIYPNLVVDLEHQALQRVMLVAQQRAMPLKVFARNGSDARDLMNEEHQNPLRIVRRAIWLLSSRYATTASRCRSNQVVT
jgi:hypothetical protein